MKRNSLHPDLWRILTHGEFMVTELGKPMEAIIRHGKIEPLEPVNLPDETRVQVTITPVHPVEEEEERMKFYRILQQVGLIEQMPDPHITPSWKLHPPIEIPGEPLSEVIIRMREPNAE